MTWVHIKEARLGCGIELLVNRKIRQTGLLPELVSILRPGAIVRGEKEKERKKRTAYCKLQVEERQTTGLATFLPLPTTRCLRRDVTAALPAQLPHMSEIDKIFAAKGNAKLIDPQPPVSSHSSKHTKKKRKHKTNLPQADNPGADPPSNSKKRPEPETIIDTSSDIHPKRPRLDNPLKKVKSKRSTEKDDEAIFKDSRGSTTRKFSTILVS